MTGTKQILAIIGSASSNSSNERLIDFIQNETSGIFQLTVFNALKTLPHFDPERSVANSPAEIEAIRASIAKADGVIICTPEYIFSVPSGLKNLLEWCVATTIFNEKPVGIITASAHGQKGHEELKRIMQTLMARFTEQTTLLIPGIKGKVGRDGKLSDQSTIEALRQFIEAFRSIVGEETGH
ncbi:NAD(P)H-dependent oxidoreductase [Flavihumibacter rivuli]|uniref:NADPH-dependent FMN reductase n=1 Tax=Flavihumibacter rivuli TaxID=2838156 RepID=UPI001BDDFE06|nr:NADPH-dependent FMN reductase [Flavihumibacter rivuli]ULQ55824.1 NAD(P)H-dependent oxidoreductase [Flavihumibacter rivuli]